MLSIKGIERGDSAAGQASICDLPEVDLRLPLIGN